MVLPLSPSRETKVCLAQQGVVVRKANEYRGFAHAMACYFADRMLAVPALEVRGRVLFAKTNRSAELCDVCIFFKGGTAALSLCR